MRWPAAVLWDMDGTLIDSQEVWDECLAELAVHLGDRLSASTKAAVRGWSVDAVIPKLFVDLGLTLDPLALARAKAWLIGRVEESFQQQVCWLPGAQAALEHVRELGLPMALVTSTHRGIAELLLKTIGAEFFAATICGDEVNGLTKPHPEPYLRAARQLGVDPTHCIAVEDSDTGVQSASAAGCSVVVVSAQNTVPVGQRRLFFPSLRGFDLNEISFLFGRVLD